MDFSRFSALSPTANSGNFGAAAPVSPRRDFAWPQQQQSVPGAGNNGSPSFHSYAPQAYAPQAAAQAAAPPPRRRIPLSARLGGNSQTAYRRKRFLVFMKVLLKILRRDSLKHPQLYTEAKAIVADCTRRNRYKDPQYCPLPEAVERRLRPMVGEAQWKRANACLDLYLEKRRQLHVQQQAVQVQTIQAQQRAALYGSGSGYGAAAYGGVASVDPLEVLPEIQNQHRLQAAAAMAAVRGGGLGM